MFTSEAEFVAILDSHDRLVRRCADGELSYQAFIAEYGDFYDSYALDGHESDLQERQLLARHAGRIELHRRVRDEVLYLACDPEAYATDTRYRSAGRFPLSEAAQRLARIVAEQSAFPRLPAV